MSPKTSSTDLEQFFELNRFDRVLLVHIDIAGAKNEMQKASLLQKWSDRASHHVVVVESLFGR